MYFLIHTSGIYKINVFLLTSILFNVLCLQSFIYSGEDSCRIVQIGSASKQSTYLESGMISKQNVKSAHSVKLSLFIFCFLACFNAILVENQTQLSHFSAIHYAIFT